MTILLTGSTGYIGRRLLTALLEDNHNLICLVRDKRRFDWEDFSTEQLQCIQVVEGDLVKEETLSHISAQADIAYYLVHSMSYSEKAFEALEETSATNFVTLANRCKVKQIVYLGGIANDAKLSKHLSSRKHVEEILQTANAPVTVLRAAIIIGSGSASYEIIRDLVEKLPIMVAPKWLNSKCQPISIRNVIEYLKGVALLPSTFNKVFDIGGPDVLTYKEMLMGYARVRNLKRWIITVPVLSPGLSSHWLYFVTSTSMSLAKTLVNSMKNEVVCRPSEITKLVPLTLLSYTEMLTLTLARIQQRLVVSSWKDAINTETIDTHFLNYIEVPTHGCFVDKRMLSFTTDKKSVIESIWRIGGNNGWYYGNTLWKLRGLLDKLVGGVGLRRGRRSDVDLKAGDALDFWRVLLADKTNARLLLFAEMKLPGEAWLEWKIKENEGKKTLIQTATFRPRGLWGRLYWYSVLPLHGLIFPKMAKQIIKRASVLAM
jgi:uncharacterized protein YbjT (DUF2867 family)